MRICCMPNGGVGSNRQRCSQLRVGRDTSRNASAVENNSGLPRFFLNFRGNTAATEPHRCCLTEIRTFECDFYAAAPVDHLLEKQPSR